jgi:hypothetical protein
MKSVISSSAVRNWSARLRAVCLRIASNTYLVDRVTAAGARKVHALFEDCTKKTFQVQRGYAQFIARPEGKDRGREAKKARHSSLCDGGASCASINFCRVRATRYTLEWSPSAHAGA